MSLHFFRLLKISFLVLDLLMLNLTFLFVMYLNNERITDAMEVEYIYLSLFFNLSWIFSSWLFKIYQQGSISSFESFSRSTLRSYLALLAIVILYIFLSKADLSRLFIITLFLSICAVLMLNRVAYLFVLQFFRKGEIIMRKVLIIGYNETSKKLVQQLEEDPISTHIIGYCEDQKEVHELSNHPIIGELSSAIEVSKENEVTEIFSTITPEQNEIIYQLIQQADHACIRFRIVPNFNFFVHFPVQIDFLGVMPVFSRRKEPLEDVSNRIKKRLVDILVSSLAIVLVLSWLIPLISLVIWLESGRPIFFLQKRTGKDNKPFNCFKFRSMKVNNDANLKQASKEDDRITRVGKILRKTSLDEFPQFLNVFLGDMSIIGPRPHMLKHTDDYSNRINQFMVRQFMKPGISGWAQVNGYRGETKRLEDMEKRVEHDLWYMENWSIWLDVRIIFLTIYQIFKGDKNAF
ncbi:MAG: undecaprenyl-phosphate glucose phosphotransferase [Chitinophagaceae bacterium]|nr:undecaprenyl-phosphate glucose phosphotransferase [Chitinophagaceae bacterium]MBP6695260.1 undecaprenyl-phosphate glucose phosphotransferase [Saprospiraceae bacterium]